ncbi:uncharacterized protein LOC116346739 [Contarinia nasturtii]|uniref:uncharacterized protein LOC116346739 n=1 Tax=Contarinia nasturtii TaxID=265458 RepID=UPI0012D4BF0F|nr:uncharacterized protein LOC116346739 [Contarinia nasturtii]
MNFLRFLLKGASTDIKTDQNEQSIIDYSNIAIVARLFAIKKTKVKYRGFPSKESAVLHHIKISTYKIYSSFKQFGAVKDIDFFVQTDKRYAYCWIYVEFYESQSVDAALLKQQIKIGDDIFKINRTKRKICNFGIVKEKINIDEILLQAPDENSPKNILNILNDDCLREIFKQLPFRDQCSVLSVCVRFNQISKKCLALGLAKKQIDCGIKSNTQILMETLLSLPLQQASDYLRNFDSSIYEIDDDDLSGRYYSMWKEKRDIVLGMISKHCTNIRKLELKSYDSYFIDIQRFSELIPLFTRLETLHLHCSHRRLDSLLPICSQLSALSLEDFFCQYPLPPIKLPKLVAFRIDSPLYKRKKSYISSLKIFLSLNTQLEVFSYKSSPWIFYSEKHDSVIGQLKGLKVLEIQCYLKKIEIIHLIRELLSNNVPIEHLKLDINIKIDDEVIECISQMNTIQKLEFDVWCHTKFDKRYLIHLALNLPNLEAMMLKYKKQIDLILVDGNIQHIVEELQEKISSELEVSMREVNKIIHFLLDLIK